MKIRHESVFVNECRQRRIKRHGRRTSSQVKTKCRFSSSSDGISARTPFVYAAETVKSEVQNLEYKTLKMVISQVGLIKY